MRLRALACGVVLFAAALAAGAAGAQARAFLPEPGASPNQADTNRLYTIAIVLGFIVFLAVEIGLITALVRFRARKGRVAAQIRGNTRLELAWTVGAGLLVTILTVLVFIELGAIKNPARSGPGGLPLAGDVAFASVDQPNPPGGGNSLRIHINGQQFLWRYDYPNGAFSFDTLYVPLDTTVVLDITASDVGHQWWIPQLGGAIDAIPGYTNHSWLKISKPGVYKGQCAQLCGRLHANMLARVCAVPVSEYQTFVDAQKQAIAQSNKDIVDERALQSRQGGNPAQPPSNDQVQAQATAPAGSSYTPPGCHTDAP